MNFHHLDQIILTHIVSINLIHTQVLFERFHRKFLQLQIEKMLVKKKMKY